VRRDGDTRRMMKVSSEERWRHKKNDESTYQVRRDGDTRRMMKVSSEERWGHKKNDESIK
jgi:hypothetical protein